MLASDGMVPRKPSEEELVDPALLSAARTKVLPTEEKEVETSPLGEERAGEADAGESFVVPPRISRFTVLRQIGEGGMGVVFSAYDDELDRKVAIKLLRPSSGDSLGKARLQREAQAMARLAHPNIVRVYEVGLLEERIFLVMWCVWPRRGPCEPEFEDLSRDRPGSRQNRDKIGPRPGISRPRLSPSGAVGRGTVDSHRAGSGRPRPLSRCLPDLAFGPDWLSMRLP